MPLSADRRSARAVALDPRSLETGDRERFSTRDKGMDVSPLAIGVVFDRVKPADAALSIAGKSAYVSVNEIPPQPSR